MCKYFLQYCTRCIIYRAWYVVTIDILNMSMAVTNAFCGESMSCAEGCNLAAVACIMVVSIYPWI